jgi:hypothetical protein
MTESTSSITFKEAVNEIALFVDDITIEYGGYLLNCAEKNFLVSSSSEINQFKISIHGAKLIFNMKILDKSPYVEIRNLNIQQIRKEQFSICFWPNTDFNKLSEGIFNSIKQFLLQNINDVIQDQIPVWNQKVT